MSQQKAPKVKGAYLYAAGMISYNLEYAFIGNLTYALTNSFGISAMAAGTIFLISRIFDGFTDILAGVIIDRWNPKVGKARVYDLLHLPLWLCVILLFSVPDVGMTAKLIWVFVLYNTVQSVIATFMNVSEPLRLQRSFPEQARLKVMSVTSIGTLVFSMIQGFTLPQLIKIYGAQPHGWTLIASIFAVPMVIFGLMRFFLLPELPQKESAKISHKLTIGDCLKALVQNKYALLYGVVMICWAMYNTMSMGTQNYFFQYIYGDIGGLSAMSIATLLTIFFIALVPRITEKFGRVQTVRFGLTVTFFGCIGRLLMPHNLIWLVLMQFLALGGIMTLGFMKPLLTIDCITYGKWKTGNAVEAAYSTVNSLADKLGLGLGSFLLGVILDMGKFDGTQTVQPDSAVFTIKMLYTVLPAALMAIALFALVFYNLEKRLPQMEQDLAAQETSH